MRGRRCRRPHLPAGGGRGGHGLRGGAPCGTLAGQQRTLTQRVLARRELCTRHTDSTTRARIFIASQRGVIVVDATKVVTDETFWAEVLKNDKPVIVDYWAECGGPRRVVAPVLDERATDA